MRQAIETHKFFIGAHAIAATLYWERRKSVRFSLTAKGPVMRAPYSLPLQSRTELIAQFEVWVTHSVSQNAHLLSRWGYQARWRDGDVLHLMGIPFELRICPLRDQLRAHGRLSFDTQQIQIHLPKGTSGKQRIELQRRILRQVIAKHFYLRVHQRVFHLHERHFKANLQRVTLRYAHARWGSCSPHNGHIMINTRLLLAPKPVREYVIIHELAHLWYPNHAKAFWHAVRQVMPDYESHKHWLQQHGATLDF